MQFSLEIAPLRFVTPGHKETEEDMEELGLIKDTIDCYR